MKRAPRIELETPIIPRAVVEAVLEEASVWLDEPLPRRWARELIARANAVYAHNPRFRRKLRGNANNGRDHLWMFVRHWLAALIRERRARLHARLPASYHTGHPLPSRPMRRIRRERANIRRSIPQPGFGAIDQGWALAAHFHLL
jgi:hypothetical protein